MKKILLYMVLIGFHVQAIASDTVSMPSVEKLFNENDLQLTYPVVLFFDAEDRHIQSHAGTLDKPLTAEVFNSSGALNSKLKYSELKSAWSLPPLAPEGSLVLLTIDERICPACANEQQAFSQLRNECEDSYRFVPLKVEFR